MYRRAGNARTPSHVRPFTDTDIVSDALALPPQLRGRKRNTLVDRRLQLHKHRPEAFFFRT